MKQRRLLWLLAVAAALALVRVLVPDHSALPETATAVERLSAPRMVVNGPPFEAPNRTVPPTPSTHEVRRLSPDFHASNSPGNAFVVRSQAVPETPLPAVQVVTQAVVSPPPAVRPSPAPRPADPAPPIQVIGIWDDGVAPGVFVSTPSGAKLARKGTVLVMDYLVTAVSPQQLTLQHTGTKQIFQLNLPRTPGK